MGYLTEYRIEILSGEDPEGLVEQLEQDSGILHDDMKWYEYEQDVREVSAKLPDVLIVVRGKGEDFEDIWQHFFKGDLHYREQIEFPHVDPWKLQN